MASHRTASIASILLLALVAPTASHASHETTYGHLPLLAKAEQPRNGWASFKFHYDGVGSGLFWGVHRGKARPNFKGSMLYGEDNELISGVMGKGARIFGNGDCVQIHSSAGLPVDRCTSPSTADSAFMTASCATISPGACDPGAHAGLGLLFEPGEDPPGIYKYLMWYGTVANEPWGWEVRGTGITLLASDEGPDVWVLDYRSFDNGISAHVAHSGVLAGVNVTPSAIEFDISDRLIAWIGGDQVENQGLVDRLRLRGPGVDRFCECTFGALVGPGSGRFEYAPPGAYSLELSGARAGSEPSSRSSFAGIVDPRVP